MDKRETELRHWEGQLAAEMAGRAEQGEEGRALLDEAAEEMKRLREAFDRGEPIHFTRIRQAFAQLDDETGGGGPPIA